LKKQSAKRSRQKSASRRTTSKETGGPGVRPLWSGTITFGLVSIPVDLLTAVRPRQTALKLIDKEGHALGRQYYCSKEGKKLANDDLVRGYETEDGKMVVITDAEFEAVAPEMSADINLRNFVPVEQIPPVYFQKPYYLVPAGKSSKAYNLLATIMQRTGRVGVGNFVMRGHEYLVAIISDNGMLRADTLRYADEIRSAEMIGLPKIIKASAKTVSQFIKEIEDLKRDELNMAELEDKEAEELQTLVKAKQKNAKNVIHQSGLESDDEEAPGKAGQVIDLMAVLRRSLSKRAVVTNADPSAPISLDERREMKRAAGKSVTVKKSKTRKSKSRASK
jgi:DNA end-binding protein Ku